MASTLVRRFPSRTQSASTSSKFRPAMYPRTPLSTRRCMLAHCCGKNADQLLQGTTFVCRRYVSGGLGNQQSSSSEESDIKTSRATDGGSPDTASVQTPVSDQSSIPGNQDEGTPSHDQVKRDPSESAEKKRAHVESQANKPLGPEDHQ